MTDTSTALTRAIDARLARIAEAAPGPLRLEAQLRELAKWRSVVLANTHVAKAGDRIAAGPFKGMAYPVAAAEGSRAARLLGAYEASLHPVIETVIDRGYPQILDIGAAEGYYAVGLALRMPKTLVHARDTDARAKALCAELAQANGVADRLRIGGEVGHSDFTLCAAAPTFVLCDIEGAEDALLDPMLAPELAQADILVEVHDSFRPGLSARLAERFQPTHRVTRIDRSLRPDLLPGWAEVLSDLDRLLLIWEWRSGPTPWLWMEHR